MSNKELIYRKGNEWDLKQLQQLGLLAYGQFKPIITETNWERWQKGFNSDENFLNLLQIATCFVCQVENEIVGMAFIIPSGNPFLYFQSDWSYIRYVGVHPNYEGKGIGKILTQQCIDEATKNGESLIALHTSEFMNAARNLYESIGFTKVKNLDLIDGKQYYLYALKLNNNDRNNYD